MFLPYLGSPDLCSSVPIFPCSSVAMFSPTYVPRYLCSPVPMFPGTDVPRAYVPRYRCSPVPMFPVPMFPVPMFAEPMFPRYLCSPVPMFPGTVVPRAYVSRYLYSPVVPVPMLSSRGDWRWWGKFWLGRCPSVPNESKCGNINDVFGEHVPTALTGAKLSLTHVLQVKYRKKLLFDNESRFLSSNFELGWTASDMARCGKGSYEDYATCMA